MVIRYPKMSCPTEVPAFSEKAEEGRGVFVSAMDFEPSFAVQFEEQGSARRILFVTTGGMYSEVLTASRSLSFDDVVCDIYSLRFIKPFDEKYFLDLAKNYDGIIFVEDGIEIGGVSEYLARVCAENGIEKFAVKAFPSEFYHQGTRSQVLAEAGLSPEDLRLAALKLLKIKK